mgnify:CR=1 FL=1
MNNDEIKQHQELRQLLSPQQVLTEASQLAHYGRDWCKHFEPNPLAICFPESTLDVQKLVLWSRRTKTPLVPSGGRTGLSGGATATAREVVVSLERMNRILSFSAVDRLLTCQAGAITEEVQNHCRDHGFYFPVDFAARGSSQIGGNIATNAGGLKVVRYGMMRDWVTGMTVVTGYGEILTLNKALVKDATGFDLKQLFIVTEGTMGIITEATLTFTSPPPDSVVMIVGLESSEHVLKLFEHFMRRTVVNAFEIFTDVALEHVLTQTHFAPPLSERYPFYVLVEAEAANDSALESLMGAFASAQEAGWILDGTLSQSASQAQQLWQYRERISESLAPRMPHKNDISVPVSRIPEFLDRINVLVATNYPGLEVVWFGHIGDGNLHFNVLPPQQMDLREFKSLTATLDPQLYGVIQALGGSISAEHGIGLTKRPFLNYSRSSEEMDLLRHLKRVMDPDGIMNPGKLLDT